MAPSPDFARHRQRLLERLKPDEAVLLFAAPHRVRNGDAEYKYRPDSDVYWLTGWTQPEVVVFLRPGEAPLTLFVQPRNPAVELWSGKRPGTEGAVSEFGADQAFDIADFADKLPILLQGVRVLHHAFAQDAEHDALLMGAIRKAAKAARTNGLDVPSTFHPPEHLLHELRLVKEEDELEIMREAARVTAVAHRAAMGAASPTAHEYEIEALVDHAFRSAGAVGPGYTSIIAGGDAANCLHYIDNDKALREGELLLIDAGAEVGFYTADVTRTFPVSGRFSKAQAQVYRWVLKAQLEAVQAVQVGAAFTSLHDVAVRVLTQGMVELNLLEGEVDELIASKAFKKYYPHGTSHWLGLDVHDVGAYSRDGASRALAPGMVLTIEPGLYIPADDTDAPEPLRGIGVRIEDDILVTDQGPVNLTAAVPKALEDVEAACLARP